MSDPNALLALKNAWTTVLNATDRVRALAPSVEALPADTTIADVEFAKYHDAVLAQATAVMALRGLLEQLRPK